MSAVLVNGFFVGLIYGLLGVGLVTLYRGSRVVHFAYGETGMVAAFVFADIRYGAGSSTLTVTDNGIWTGLPVAVPPCRNASCPRRSSSAARRQPP